jgi:hypothetical protein
MKQAAAPPRTRSNTVQTFRQNVTKPISTAKITAMLIIEMMSPMAIPLSVSLAEGATDPH